MRLWYTPIAFVDFMNLLIGTVLLAFLGLLLWATISLWGSDLSEKVKDEKTNRDLFIQAVFWLSWGALFLIGAAVNFFRNRLFPFANFLIGDGVSRFNTLGFRRRTIGVGFLLSVIASVVASILMK
jgi:hypothetical protein